MNARSAALPSLTIVRVATPAGPYRAGDLVSLAFTEPTIARLLAHDTHGELARAADPIVPETMSVTISSDASPYRAGQVVTLSFVDPAVARVHPGPAAPLPTDPARANGGAPEAPAPPHVSVMPVEAAARTVAIAPLVATLHHEPRDAVAAFARAAAESGVAAVIDDTFTRAQATAHYEVATPVEPAASQDAGAAIEAAAALDPNTRDEATTAQSVTHAPTAYDPPLRQASSASAVASEPNQLTPDGVISRLGWPSERAARFVQVVDKLFTVDRLGSYRHVLATRLLVADDLIATGTNAEHHAAVARAAASLRIVRAAGLEALGAPLLAAYLPGFSVTSDWLATLELPALGLGLERLCDELALTLGDDTLELVAQSHLLSGVLTRESLIEPYRAHRYVDATLPCLVPTSISDRAVRAALARYRETTLDLMTQLAPAPADVRVRHMTQPNPVLDDQLWNVVGVIQQSLVRADVA